MEVNNRQPRIEIPCFPQNRRIAVTTSFDDGAIEDRRVVEVFGALGLKGSFNLNSGTAEIDIGW